MHDAPAPPSPPDVLAEPGPTEPAAGGLRRFVRAAALVVVAAAAAWSSLEWPAPGTLNFTFYALVLAAAWVVALSRKGRRLGRAAALLALMGAGAGLTAVIYHLRRGELRGDTSLQNLHLVAWGTLTVQAVELAGVLCLIAGLDIVVASLTRRMLRPRTPNAKLPAREHGWRRAAVGAIRLLVFWLVGIPWLFVFLQTHPPKVAYDERPDVPYRELADLPGDPGMPGWVIPTDGPADTVVLICHGLGADEANFLPWADLMHGLHCHVVIFDLPGHGRAAGDRTTLGWDESRAILRTARWVRSHPEQFPGNSSRLIGFGASMGGTSLLLAAESEPHLFDGLIVDSSYATLDEMARERIDMLPAVVRWPMQEIGPLWFLWETGVRISRVDVLRDIHRLDGVPKLFIHCRDDQIVPFPLGEQIYDAAGGPKAFKAFDTGNHLGGLTRHGREYRDMIEHFLSRGRTASQPAAKDAPRSREPQ
ncbi:MAG: hypothetical protein BIFFINMI_00564 [Phycisphaerae bacterium]|nr:hypothetical protein [Phycisphaerae bacterium]